MYKSIVAKGGSIEDLKGGEQGQIMEELSERLKEMEAKKEGGE